MGKSVAIGVEACKSRPPAPLRSPKAIDQGFLVLFARARSVLDWLSGPSPLSGRVVAGL